MGRDHDGTSDDQPRPDGRGRSEAVDLVSLPLLADTEGLEYDHTSNSYRITFDWRSADPSEAVIHAVAAVSDRDATELEPLYAAVEPDALDRLVTSMASVSSTGGSVAFTFEGHQVHLTSDGLVSIAPRP
jgi:hypothetical protein